MAGNVQVVLTDNVWESLDVERKRGRNRAGL